MNLDTAEYLKVAILSPEALNVVAHFVEEQTHFLDGIWVDGAPYSSATLGVPSFMAETERALGNGNREVGHQMIQNQVCLMEGDPGCGNWQLTAALVLSGVELRTQPVSSFASI
jgi:hypothetical protein